jgi:hypothetical protein
MDTKEMELKQGATADLSQQNPHVEVVDSKNFSISSDKERLAAGINDWAANQETLWSTAEKAHQRKKDGGDLDGRETSKKNSLISG